MAGGIAAPELLPCPFCGGKVEAGYYAEEFVVDCPECRFEVSTYDDGPNDPSLKGIRHWNTRIALPSPAPDAIAQAAQLLLDAMPNYAMERAALESQAVDDEGPFYPLTDLLDFSAENKAHTVIREALCAAFRALAQDQGQ